MKRRYVFPFLFLAATPGLAALEPVDLSQTIEPLGGMQILDMLPEEMRTPDVTPLIEYTGDTFDLSFADYREQKLRKASVYFSSKVATVDDMRNSLNGLSEESVLDVSGQRCVLKDAIIVLNMRCLIGAVVLILDKSAPMSGSEADKAAAIEELMVFANMFPLETILAAQGAGAETTDLPPDTQKRLGMRVPGLNVETLKELVPVAMHESDFIDVKYIRNDLGFLLEVMNGDVTNDPVVRYYLSNWESFGTDILEAHANAGESGKVTGASMESWAVKIDGYPCLAAGSDRVAKLDCLVGDVSVLLSREIYDNAGVPDPLTGPLAELIEYADTVPLEAIALAQKK